MKVLLYFEHLNLIKQSGIGRALLHQKRALELAGIEYTTDPDDSFDIAHVNTYHKKSRKLIKKCKKNNIPVLVHGHSTIEDFKKSFRCWKQIQYPFNSNLKKTYSLADRIITPTNYSKNLIESYSFIKCPVDAVSNGIDLNEYKRVEISKEEIKELKQRYGIKENETIVIGIGFLFERKGILDFIEVARKMPNIKFIWFGSKNAFLLPHKINKAIYKKPDNLIIPGYVNKEDIKKYLQISSCFFFPSLEETEGIVSLEALAMKTPLVVRNIGVFDRLEDKKDCIKGDSVDDFINAINYIIENDTTSMVESAYEKVKLNSIENVSQQLSKIYNELIKS